MAAWWRRFAMTATGPEERARRIHTAALLEALAQEAGAAGVPSDDPSPGSA